MGKTNDVPLVRPELKVKNAEMLLRKQDHCIINYCTHKTRLYVKHFYNTDIEVKFTKIIIGPEAGHRGHSVCQSYSDHRLFFTP